MRWIAALIVVVLQCYLSGCSTVGSHQTNSSPTTLTLLDCKADDPLVTCLKTQGVPVRVDDVGCLHLTNDEVTVNALKRWLLVQRATMETVAKNLAHQDAIIDANGDYAPYRRQLVKTDRHMTIRFVNDESPFRKRYEPDNQFADFEGYVNYPNIDASVELIIAMEASRQYQLAETLIQRFDRSTVTQPSIEQDRNVIEFDEMRREMRDLASREQFDTLQKVSQIKRGVIPLNDRVNLKALSTQLDIIANNLEKANATGTSNRTFFEDLIPPNHGSQLFIGKALVESLESTNVRSGACFQSLDSDNLALLMANIGFELRREIDLARIELMSMAHGKNGSSHERPSYKRIDQAIVVAMQLSDVSLENISNANTPGYRCRVPIVDPATMSLRIQHDTSQGSPIRTDRLLDVMIIGEGYFRISNGKDSQKSFFTRAANFFINEDGQLVLGNAEGPLVLPPIVIPSEVSVLEISSDGRILGAANDESKRQEYGRLQLARFKDPSRLQRVSGNLWMETPESGTPILGNAASDGFGKVLSKFLESSNVDPIVELKRIHQNQHWLRVVRSAVAAMRSDIKTINGESIRED